MLIFTADHGTFNGDHGRLGKLQTHEHDAVGHIPFIVCHPRQGHGEAREQLVQLVDIFPTVLAAVGRPLPTHPRGLHGVNLLPVLADQRTPTRRFALAGQFGMSVSITDGRWILHQSPVAANEPLRWHGYALAKFLRYDLGPYRDGSRPVQGCRSWPEPTWLSDKTNDPNELVNLAVERPDKLRQMQQALRVALDELHAPEDQAVRLGLLFDTGKAKVGTDLAMLSSS
jgi:arylsulfatase A-like enzyme